MAQNRNKNVTQETSMKVIALLVLAVFIIQGVRLAFFWSLGETQKYIHWLMPGEFSWALAWFIQVGGDSFHLIAYTAGAKNRALFWGLHVFALVFNIADGSTNLGSLRASPLVAVQGFDSAIANHVEFVIAYGTAFVEQLVILALVAFVAYWSSVTKDLGWGEWARPDWATKSGDDKKRPQSPAQQGNHQPQHNGQRPHQSGEVVDGNGRYNASDYRSDGRIRHQQSRPGVRRVN